MSTYTTRLEGSNVTVSRLCFTVSGKSQVTHKQECHKGAPWLIHCDQSTVIMALDFWGVHIRLSTRCKIFFTLKSLSLSLKSYMNVPLS